jgi:predicted nucleic acid-binding protein
MSGPVFLDTNVVFSGFTKAGPRTTVAEELLLQGGVVSVQVLNELVSAVRKKLRMNWDEVRRVIDDTLLVCPNPRPLRLETHRSALRICSRYGFGVYDGLIIASALEAGCAILYTEDLQHGQIVEGLRIENPFLGAAMP